MLEATLAAFGVSLLVTYLTNPFVRLTIVRLPYRVRLHNLAHEVVNQNHKIKVYHNLFMKLFAWYQCGVYILSTRYVHQAASPSTTVKEIVQDIHQLRFNPNKLLLISGDHFNGLFVRNLGVFYYPTLDPYSTSSEHDWQDRQETYLQTVAYALGVFQKAPELKTTLVAAGRYSAVGINFYSYPSDSLYGLLYAMAALLGRTGAGSELYRRPKPKTARKPRLKQAFAHASYPLDTVEAAKVLLNTYQPLLRTLYAQYKTKVFDTHGNLIRTTIHLSGAKDITKRQSAFYDNVILWRTSQLAMELGIIPWDRPWLASLKRTILKTFWYEKGGYFIEDQSPEALEHHYYSSDWLIVLSTGFLDITKPRERRYYEASMRYIAANGIARPFAIKYQADTRAHRQFLPVRLAVASYGGDAIWSFWGMEYSKTALLLYRETKEPRYKKEAEYHIKRYQQNILKFKGFPEVYSPDGRMLQTPFYKSILMTGWVVGFEQVLAMQRELATA